MNRTAIRTLVRRRLLEETADDWTDDNLNDLINMAYALVAKEVRKVDSEAIIHWEYRDTVVGTNWYEKPEGTRGPTFVGLMGTAGATTYTELTRKAYHVARLNTNAEDTVYCHRGRYIGIFPAPTAAITDGIEFMHAPTPELSEDTDVPEIEETLQYGMVCWATMLAKGDGPEDDTKEANELRRILTGIPDDYGTADLGQPLLLQPDASDARGRFGGARIANDRDPGRTA
jgi:hypothetical protein